MPVGITPRHPASCPAQACQPADHVLVAKDFATGALATGDLVTATFAIGVFAMGALAGAGDGAMSPSTLGLLAMFGGDMLGGVGRLTAPAPAAAAAPGGAGRLTAPTPAAAAAPGGAVRAGTGVFDTALTAGFGACGLAAGGLAARGLAPIGALALPPWPVAHLVGNAAALTHHRHQCGECDHDGNSPHQR